MDNSYGRTSDPLFDLNRMTTQSANFQYTQQFVLESEAPVMDEKDYMPITGMRRIIRNNNAVCNPEPPKTGDHYKISGPYGTVKDVHPSALAPRDCRLPIGASLSYLDGIPVALPRFDLMDIQGYLLGNPWHYAAVKAKATAATEMGYKWKPIRSNQRGVGSQSLQKLIAFEERIYEKNHKDLGALLQEQATDYFSTGNKAIEIGYTYGGTLDCIYTIPAVTLYRHPYLPIACQGVSPWEESSFLLSANQPGMQLKAVMPLFRSGWTREDLVRNFPRVNPALLSNNEVLHVTNQIISTDPFYGIAPILAALTSMMGDNATNEYNLQFFKNNAIPRFAISLGGGIVTEQVKNSILRFFNEQIQGNNHRTIIVPVPRGMTADFKALDATPNEGSFLRLKAFYREEILTIHDVPPSVVGVLENANKANIQQQSKDFFMRVIRPYQRNDERMMNRLISTSLNIDDVVFQFEDVEYTDDQERATVLVTLCNAKKLWMDPMNNTLQILSSLVPQEAPKPAASTPGQPAAAPAPVKQEILTAAEIRKYMKTILDDMARADEIFGVGTDLKYTEF